MNQTRQKPLTQLAPRRAGTGTPLQLQRAAIIATAAPDEVPALVPEVLRTPGQPLDPATRAALEPRFGHDFSGVRVHADHTAAQSARAVNALAYTVGPDIVFGAGQYAPATPAGQRLVAHELAHVVQQHGSRGGAGEIGLPADERTGEMEAERAAAALSYGAGAPPSLSALAPAVQRKVEMRDVGRGEQSGFARLPELITRLNTMSPGLTYAMDGRELSYHIKDGGTPGFFDRQMMAFIDQEAVIPLRLTNRHGLLGTRETGFHDQVDVDAWTSGYVDIDDLLASSDLGLQSVFVHFLRERSATSNYARRIGTDTFTEAEFRRTHGQGLQAEEELLRDFFGDPSIHIVNDSPSPTVRRVFRNSRRDLIRRRVTRGTGEERGVNAMSMDVWLRDGRVMTAEEYRRLLEEERAAAARRRSAETRAGEYHAGGVSVPAP